jgi:protein-L-isoaspartate O-methyltransferase
VEFTAAKVVSNVKDAEMLHRVVVDVGDLAAGYSKGGQFMQIKVRPARRFWPAEFHQELDVGIGSSRLRAVLLPDMVW